MGDVDEMLPPRLILATCVFIFALSSARAWDPLGHMLTMQIASGELTPKAREELDAAIGRFNAKEHPDAPYDAVTAACWMDDVRGRTKDFNEWHYVNLPFTREGQPVPEGSRSQPNVVWGIDRCEAIVKGEAEEPGIDHDQALFIMMHLVGDIHQPMHTTNRDDFGGNRVSISNMKEMEADLIFSKGGNLHFFWDSAYRRIFENGQAGVSYAAPLHPRQLPVTGHRESREMVDKTAAEIKAAYPSGSFKDKQEGTPAEWALESHALGYNLAYGKLPAGKPVALNEAYVNESKACAQQRIALAGYRLAAMLNRLLDPQTAR